MRNSVDAFELEHVEVTKYILVIFEMEYNQEKWRKMFK